MAAELVETSQLFARIGGEDRSGVARARPPGRCASAATATRTGSRSRRRSMAKEHVTLFGLPIVKDRKVALRGRSIRRCAASCSSPTRSCAHEYTTKGAFMEHNRALLDEVQRLRDKARRSDMLADEYALVAFFDQRVPDERRTAARRSRRGARRPRREDPRSSHLSLADVLLDEAARALARALPRRSSTVRGATLPLSYRFDPGEDDDGITPPCRSRCCRSSIPGAGLDHPGLARGQDPRAARVAAEGAAQGARRPLDELARELAARAAAVRRPDAARARARDLRAHRRARAARRVGPRDLPPYLRFTSASSTSTAG